MIQTNDKKTDSFKTFATVMTVLLPLLRYQLPGIPQLLFCDIAVILLIFLSFVYSKTIEFDTRLIFFAIYVGYASVVVIINLSEPYFDLNESLGILLRQIVYYVFLFFVPGKFFDKKTGHRVYIIIAVVCSAVVIVQYFIYIVFGLKTSFIIPFLTADGGYTDKNFLSIEWYRPASFFFEPATYAFYALPALFLTVLDKRSPFKRPSRFVFALILLFGLICCGSTTALICLGIAGLLYVFRYLRGSNGRIKIRDVFIALMALLVFVVVIRSDWMISGLSKLYNLDSGSGATRVTRGFEVLSNVNFLDRVFGCGWGNYANYILYYGIITGYDYIQGIEITNSVVYIMLENGIIGLIFYSCQIILLFVKRKRYYAKCILILIIVLAFGTAILSNIIFCLLYSLVIGKDEFEALAEQREGR